MSIDIDPTLIATARKHLDSLGHHPTLIVGDGASGVASHAPYDRIIATAAIAEIPVPWIEQLAPNGKILANLRGDLAGGTLCLLSQDDNEVIGPILPIGGHFMWLRPQADSPLRAPEPSHVRSSRSCARTSTALDASALIDNDSFRFLLQLQLRGARGFRFTKVHDLITRTLRHGIFVEASDGSYAEAIVDPEVGGQLRVIQVGPRRLWDTVEGTHQLWRHLGQPDPDRFGIVANATTQFVWFDNDDGWYRWPLPLA